ncbi:hypothetical protein EGW08_018221 [Elysia chlorotica]|uniref:Polysaccharide lyase 14 domain-containing protein n=1 Tax=Elysia chlorotica TaxID=188477 RepID=A0A433SXJ4_ELYCH|nr:hypothetical protein EGW08_018221 [Elysia chlorotica]
MYWFCTCLLVLAAVLSLGTLAQGHTRRKRSTEIWRVNSVPQSTDRKTLLRDFEPYFRQWGDDSFSGRTSHSSSPALSIHYAKGSYTGWSSNKGGGFYSTPPEVGDHADAMIFMYDVYFENFGFGKGGKLPGLFGGVKGDGAYACSGGSNPDTCFSLRLMWRENGDGELYAYIPPNQESGFADRDDVIAHSSYGQSIGRGKIKFQNGAWNTVLIQARLNSVGNHDGKVKVCNTVQGQAQQCFEAGNLLMRNHGGHHIRGLFFSTFFGGSKPEYGAPNDCRTYFKNFRLKLPSSGSDIVG